MKKTMLFIVSLLLSLSAGAEEVWIDQIGYNIDPDSGTAVLTRGANANGDFTIPESIEFEGRSYRVTVIENDAFNINSLTSLTIPKSIVAIGLNAFSNNLSNRLSAITVEKGNPVYDSREDCNAIIETASNSLVLGCNTSKIPRDVTYIRDFAFRGCEGLEAITIPEGIYYIGEYAFAGCTNLSSIAFPESLSYVFISSFEGTAWLKSQPKGILYINNMAVGYNGEITENTTITIKEGTKKICKNAFRFCENITSVILAQSVTFIDIHAFAMCRNLSSITLSDSLYVGLWAFSDCTSLKAITIFSGEIDSYAFENCSNLESITIGTGVKGISDWAFMGCTSLTTVSVHQGLPFSITSDVFDSCVYEKATLYVPTGRRVFFQEDKMWGAFSNIVEQDMPDVIISDSPFENLHAGRLILSDTNRQDGGGSSGGTPDDDIVQAVMFPKERMMPLKGNQITHIRFCLWHTDFTDMKLWIGTAKDKHDLLEQDVANPQEGWTEVVLNQPYTITGDSIYVGISCHDNIITYPVKWDASAGIDNNIKFREGKWSTYNGTWYIQCMVQGDNVPQRNIRIEKLEGPVYKKAIKAGEGYMFTVYLRNWGSMEADGTEALRCLLNGKEVECEAAYGRSYNRIKRGGGLQEIALYMKVSENTDVGAYSLALMPRSGYGEAEQKKEITMKVYAHDMGRQKVLVQNYTGTWCGHCPEFETLISEIQKQRDDLSVIAIHCDDKYSTEADDSYITLLPRSGIPDVDLDRCIWLTTNNYRDYTMEYNLDDAKAQPSFANVNIAGEYDGQSRQLSITVTGERNEDFLPVERWTNLTVLLVEDGVLGGQTSSALSPNYPHNGVIRKNVSAIWGDLVEWTGDGYRMQYSATLDKEWNKDNMRIVAFLSKPFTGDNYDEVSVINTEELPLSQCATAIISISTDSAVSDIYDLHGRKVRSQTTSLEGLPKGIYIKNGRKIIAK